MKGITFVYDTPFDLDNITPIKNWIGSCLESEGYRPKQISVAFMDDEALLRINKSFLEHDDYTDVITFDYSDGKALSCDIAISIERVRDNAAQQHTSFEEELRRVVIHGLLHCMGYGDKTEEQKSVMRQKENQCLARFHVEPKTQNHV